MPPQPSQQQHRDDLTWPPPGVAPPPPSQSERHTRLGQVRPAMVAQDRALVLCQPDDYTDWALTRLDRATCLALQGDPLAAAEYAAGTLGQLGTGQRQGLITVRAAELADALPSICQPAPAVRDSPAPDAAAGEDCKPTGSSCAAILELRS